MPFSGDIEGSDPDQTYRDALQGLGLRGLVSYSRSSGAFRIFSSSLVDVPTLLVGTCF